MDTQEIILAIILVAVAAISIRKFYRMFTGKETGCNCGCGSKGKQCHCSQNKEEQDQ